MAALLAVAEAFDAPGVTAGAGFAISGVLPVAALWPRNLREPIVVAAAAASVAMTLLAAALPRLRPEHTFGFVEAAALSWLLVRVTMDRPIRGLLRLLPPLFLAVALLPLRLALEGLVGKGNMGALLSLGAAFAIMLGLYLRQLQRYRADALRAARQAQRLEYARDLHDFVAHHVTAIVAQARAVRYTTGAGHRVEPERLDTLLADIDRAGTEAMTSMRAMVGMLRDEAPPALPYRTIGEVVTALADGFAGPGTTAVCSVDARLAHRAVPADTLVTVHHTVQEALTNVMRHASGATRIEIGVQLNAGAAEITVTDDGTDAPAAPVKGGFGLRGLAERVEAAGGSLVTGPASHGGWRLTATLPLPRHSRLRSYAA
ncbi:sensor histidine kinase [Micromonospora avicenniae]|uniref:sensor histidine kinase n=1 Tax=Micromonospora avicenniae TaxID=1198245 RepID=UPI003318CCF1